MSGYAVLHCIATMEGGGAERQLCYLIEGLIGEGVEVHVGLLKEGVNYARLENSGAIIHKIDIKNNYDPIIIKRLISIIKHNNLSVVQCWQRPMDVFGGLSAILCNVPFITMERTSPSVYKKTLKSFLRVAVSQFSTAVVSNSIQGKKFWDRNLLRKIPNIVIGNIIPFNELPICSTDCARGDYLIAIGRLSPEKNYDVLIDAMKEVNKTYPHQILNILGEGPLREKLEFKIGQAGLTSRITLIGYTDRVWEWICNAKAYISLSLYEGTPNTALEAAALLCPMILSKNYAHAELFDGDTATFVDHESINDVANGIIFTLENYSVVKTKADCARNHVKKYNKKRIVAEYIKLYESIM